MDHCLLWGIVALRLLLPDTLHSSFSLIPSAEVFPQDILTSQTPAIHSGIPAVNSTINPMITQTALQGGISPSQILSVAVWIWLAGIGVMLLFGIISYLALRIKVAPSIRLRDNIFICDNVQSPFIMNFIRPRIYIPSDIDQRQLEYVLAHEYAHIKRMDHLWKPLCYLLLSVYWFNPLLWVAYVLLCRDIELACDEKVIAKMDAASKKGYSQALLACSVHRRTVMICPVAFGELSVKARIKSVVNYKKPTFWILIAAGVLSTAAAICFLTSPTPCPHQYTAQSTLPSTCTQQGMDTYTCSLCDHSYTAGTPTLSHSYQSPVVTQSPTCIATGIQELTCSCGAKHSEVIPMTAHIDGQLFVSKAPNCTETGEESTVCTYCQAEYVVRSLETNQEHALVETVLQPATCTASGEGVHTCTRCSYEESCTYEQLSHAYELYSVYPPTCQGQEMYYRCTDCGFTRIEYGPEKGGHDWFGSSYLPSKYCSLCGAIEFNEDYDGSSYSLLDNVIGNKPHIPELPIISIDDPFLH